MTVRSASPPTPRLRPWFAALLLLAGTAGFAAAWTLLGLSVTRLCAWMAVVAAIDIVFLLRLAHVHPGPGRAAVATVCTGLTCVLANWWIAGSQMGYSVGMPPTEALQRLGSDHGWTLIRLANTPGAWAWYGAGLLTAWWLGMRWR